jgi:hypothetical protein
MTVTEFRHDHGGLGLGTAADGERTGDRPPFGGDFKGYVSGKRHFEVTL